MSIEAVYQRIQEIRSLHERFFPARSSVSFRQMLDDELTQKAEESASEQVSSVPKSYSAADSIADARGSLPLAATGSGQVGDVTKTLPWGQYKSSKLLVYPSQNAGHPTYTGQVTPEIWQQAQPYLEYIEHASSVYGVPANIIMAIIKRESDFVPTVTSSSGAMGLMQNMPFNCEDYGLTDPYDPFQSIMCGTWQLAELLDMYDGDLRLAMVGYAIGCGTLRRAGVTSSDSLAYQTKVPQHTLDYTESALANAGVIA